MSDALLVFGLAVSTVGMAAFALSIGAHWRQVMGERPHPVAARVALRLLGAALLAVAFLLCAAVDPMVMAMLVWPMLLMVAAAGVAAAVLLHAAFRRRRDARPRSPGPSRRVIVGRRKVPAPAE